jgi:serine/threonine-protein kinase
MGLLSTFGTDSLIGQIKNSDSFDDASAQKAIAKLRKNPKVTIPKVADLLNTSSKAEYNRTVDILIELVSPATLEYFILLLCNDSERVRQGATEALSKANDFDPNVLITFLGDDKISKSSVLLILTAHKNKIKATNIIRFIFNVEHNERVTLFKILESTATENDLTEIINRLDNKDAYIRASFARILKNFDKEHVRFALIKLLDDEQKTVRLAALESLCAMSADLDIEKLVSLINDSDFNVQAKAIETILSVGHPETVKYLVPYLKEDSEYTRRAAVEVLNEIASPDSIRDLFKVIKDEDWWVRSRSADALGKIGGPKVVKAVIALLKDKDEFVRRSAIEIINATEDESTYNALIGALGDSDWWVRERAVDGLANLGNKQAVPLLIKLLHRNQENKSDKNSESMSLILLKALGKLKSKSAVPDVIDQLSSKSENIVKEALACLEMLVDEMNIDEIVTSIGKSLEKQSQELRELGDESIERILASQDKDKTSIREADNEFRADKTMPGTVIRGKQEAQPKSVDPSKLKPGDILAGRYRFIKQVGKGAFGSVYLMEDLMINEDVILKFLNAQFVTDDSVIKRFIYELRFARKVTHQNVIRIYDLITFGDLHAISMEYFESHTLSTELKSRKPLPNERVIKITNDICEGMESAHNANVIHRDLKPNNVMINEEDQLKIVDFGIAAASQSSDTKLTKTGLLVGTPTYMSPEQVLGKEIDEKTDIYSLGTIMYEMLTGRPPYSGKDSMSIMYQHVQGEAKPPIEKNENIPVELSELTMRCMKVKPEDRIQSMTELKESLSKFKNNN